MYKKNPKTTFYVIFGFPLHRSDGIRTHDPFVPNEVR